MNDDDGLYAMPNIEVRRISISKNKNSLINSSISGSNTAMRFHGF